MGTIGFKPKRIVEDEDSALDIGNVETLNLEPVKILSYPLGEIDKAYKTFRAGVRLDMLTVMSYECDEDSVMIVVRVYAK